MKMRRELNMLLYSQKAGGGEQHSFFEKNDYLAVRQGNCRRVKNQLESGRLSLSNSGRILSDDELRKGIYVFITEAEEIARTAVSSGMSCDEAYALADIYIKKADKCAEYDRLEKIFGDMCLDFTERISEITADISASPYIRKCKMHIYQNLNGDLSVSGLAKLTGINPSYLSKLFSREVGVPIKKFVTEAKIDTAQNLLKYTDLTYIEIAYSLGFSSQSSFIRTFKSAVGVTPKKYREMH